MSVMPHAAQPSTPPDRPSARWALALALLLGASPTHCAAARTRSRTAGRQLVLPAAFNQPDGDETLAARIVAFARDHEGRQVGGGECTDLAEQALQHAGARGAQSYGTVTDDADYVWGQPVALKDARPGDILQFRDFNVTTTVTTNVQIGWGRTAREQSWSQDQRPHHTAIVAQNLGGVLTVFEQNAPPKGQEVQINRVPITSMTVPGAANDDMPGFATTEIAVEGQVMAYRPQPL